MEAVAQRYAESLFALAKEDNQVEAYYNDMVLIEKVFNSDKSFVSFFSHVLIENDVKIKLLDDSFKGQISPYTLNFLKLLVKKKRMNYINSIIKAFFDLTNEYKGIEEGVLYTAYDIPDNEIKKIEEAISKKENKTVKLRVLKDSSLVGGIKVQIDNRVYDDSIANRLSTLKKELLRK
ncbi:MAG: F0F1 ATP synthase subunit delta [Thomasclavelia sp.]|nr:F0F1 ATP synthase subunit delta [Thomasclavelia sp.]